MRTFYLRIRPERIGLFRFLLEGYDGLAVLSTIDAKKGLVRLIVPDSRYAELWRLLVALCEDLCLRSSKRERRLSDNFHPAPPGRDNKR